MTDTASVTKSPALVRGFSQDVAADALPHRVYLVPRGQVAARGALVPAFEVLVRLSPIEIVSTIASREVVLDWARAESESALASVKRRMAAIDSPRASFAGLSLNRPAVMGILNITPDSFSDGGDNFSADVAVANGLKMLDAGADILDIGGESTRPGADPVGPEEEIARVVPVVRRLAEAGALVSIDTRHAAVMEAAVAAGAGIVNDVTSLAGDPEALATVARLGIPVVLMHMQGEPRTMQKDPTYSFAPLDVFDALEERVGTCMAAGIAREDICVDPGLGFGKTPDHNAQILKRLGLYHGLACPVLLGFSRKSSIARMSRGEEPKDRLAGSLAAAVSAFSQGVQIVRVHDVPETLQARAVWAACDAVT